MMHAQFRTPEEDALIDLLHDLEPGLSRDGLASLIEGAFSNRAQRRRAATALVADPGLLTCGRPDGLVAVDLLIHHLADHGAMNVVRPACPRCQSTDIPTEGLDGTRVCRPCKAKWRHSNCACVTCGSHSASYRDRHGNFVCRKCRTDKDTDPVEAIFDLIAPLTAGTDPGRLREVIAGVARHHYDLLRLSWEIEDRPSLLTGEAAYGSALLARLVNALAGLGAAGIVAPPLPSLRGTSAAGEPGRRPADLQALLPQGQRGPPLRRLRS
jgi:hypothetical protein